MTGDTSIVNTLEEGPAVFAIRFRRCRRLLYFIATRVLGAEERADDAVDDCFITASRPTRRFGSEGAFRCWLLRVLIDEALLILREEGDAIPISREVNVGPNHKELRAS